jgi:CRISPR-associated protein Cst1
VKEEFEGKVRVYPSDWRWSAAIVGISKFCNFLQEELIIKEDEIKGEYVEVALGIITEENYLLFAEEHFKDDMHHRFVEQVLEGNEITEEQIKLVNEKLKANSIMKKLFKGTQFIGKNANELLGTIKDNKTDIINQTFRNGKSLYANFCNENNLLKDVGDSCRIKGYYVDPGRKAKSLAFARNKSAFVHEDSILFDFIPFAFSKTREALFINNNFSIEQLINTNKNDLMLSEENSAKSELFFKVKDSASFIDYDVEVIKKDRVNDYFETIFVRKDSIEILKKIEEKTVKVIKKPCNLKRREKSQGEWLNIQQEVTDSILNIVKLDSLIEKLLKSDSNHSYLIANLILVNLKIYSKIYKGGNEMDERQRAIYGVAEKVKLEFKDKKNKLRTYEKRLICSIALKDYERVQEILLHLSSNSKVRMNFLIDLFEDFEKNKNLAFTFINLIGEKELKQ